MRPRLHLFNPENDLALAMGLANYTPPGPARRLALDLRNLPLLYASEGDALLGDTLERPIDEYEPAPWGWSTWARRVYLRAGMAASNLPSIARLEQLRQLSHRRTSARLAAMTHIGTPAEEVTNEERMREMLASGKAWMLKTPWSSSGRGLIDTSVMPVEDVVRCACGTIANQGSIMAEPLLAKTLDFALLYDAVDGRIVPAGLSVFDTRGLGAYVGNVVAPEDRLRATVASHVAHFESVEVAITDALGQLVAPYYEGPLGVDMIATPDGPAICEINLRMTMGRVAVLVQPRIGHGRLSFSLKSGHWHVDLKSGD